VARNVPSPDAGSSTDTHEGPARKPQAGQSLAVGASPRSALVGALSDAIRDATLAGDTDTAQVAYQALGRLMDKPDSSAPEAVPIERLIVARRRDKLGRP
jgi:hypothetical protein